MSKKNRPARASQRRANRTPEPIHHGPPSTQPTAPTDAKRVTLPAEILLQFRTIVATSLVTLVVSSFIPDWLKYTIRYGLLYALQLSIRSWVVPVVATVLAAAGLWLLRARRSVAISLATSIAAWLFSVSLIEAVHFWKPVRGKEPTIGFFGFLRSTEDGALREAQELANVADTFSQELEAAHSSHVCSAKSGFAVTRYHIPSFYLALNSRASLKRYIAARHPDAIIAMWGFVGPSGDIEEFVSIPMIPDLYTETVTIERESEQFIRVFNKSPSTRIAAARFGARTFGALFGYSWATVLKAESDSFPLLCATASQAMLDNARAAIAPLPGFEAEIAAHKAYWTPAFLVMRAQELYESGRREDAAKLFAEAAVINPYFPYTTREDYISALHLRDVAEALNSRQSAARLADRDVSVDAARRAVDYLREQVPQPYGSGFGTPVLVSLVRSAGSPESLSEPFTRVLVNRPNEAIVWLHWGDAYREIMLFSYGANASMPREQLFPILMDLYEPAVERYERALRLDPDLTAARQRLFRAYIVFTLWDPERREHWIAKADSLFMGTPRKARDMTEADPRQLGTSDGPAH